MGRKKLDDKVKKVKINITIDPSHLIALAGMGVTISEAVRKLIDDKIKESKNE
jgi:antitoxin component of RelBE/YafQ-DinJ toxin-antitoxin module